MFRVHPFFKHWCWSVSNPLQNSWHNMSAHFVSMSSISMKSTGTSSANNIPVMVECSGPDDGRFWTSSQGCTSLWIQPPRNCFLCRSSPSCNPADFLCQQKLKVTVYAAPCTDTLVSRHDSHTTVNSSKRQHWHLLIHVLWYLSNFTSNVLKELAFSDLAKKITFGMNFCQSWFVCCIMFFIWQLILPPKYQSLWVKNIDWGKDQQTTPLGKRPIDHTFSCGHTFFLQCCNAIKFIPQK